MDSRAARRDIRAPIHDINDIENCLSGLTDVAEQMLHPLILDHAQVIFLGAQVRRAWQFYGGRTNVSKLKLEVEQRLSERAENVRAYETIPQGNVPNLNEWGDLSKYLPDQATNAGYIVNLNDSAQREPSQEFGEAVAGRTRKVAVGVNADGNDNRTPRKTLRNSKAMNFHNRLTIRAQ